MKVFHNFITRHRWTAMRNRRRVVGGQEIMAAGADLPLTAPESTVPAPMQRRLRQSTRKVGSINLSITCHLDVVMRRSSNNVLLCNAAQGGLSQCAIGQEGGKENVDPAPIPNLPRMRSTKKVRFVLL